MQKRIPENSVLIPDTARQVFAGEIFDVFQWPQQMYDGSTATFEMLRRADTVSIICVVDGKIIVLDEEQPNRGPRRNFPGGRVDPDDESVLAAAKREVLEETGYTFRQWRLVKVFQPYAKMEWFIHIFIAWDADGHQAVAHDPGEKITINRLDMSEVTQQVEDRVGYLGESADIFENIRSTEELLETKEFTGREVDR